MNLISLDPKVLDAALTAVKPAVGARSAVAALAGVQVSTLGDNVVLEATNLETSVRKEIATAVVHGDVDALVSHAELHRVAKLFKGKPVTLSIRDGNLTVTNGSRFVSIPQLRREDFPARDFSGDYWLTLDARAIAPILERALLFTSPDETRPLLTGIYIEQGSEGIRVTATDSYRLVTTNVAHGASNGAVATSAVVPGRMVKMALRALKKESAGVPVYQRENVTIWSLPDARELWMSRKIEGNYPNHRQLIPDDTAFTATVVAPRDAIMEAVAAANALAVRNSPVRLGVNGAFDVNLRGVDSPSMEERIDGARITHRTADGTAAPEDAYFEYGVNPAFLLDTLKSTTGDDVTFKFISPLRPVLIAEPGTKFLVMPIRLNV